MSVILVAPISEAHTIVRGRTRLFFEALEARCLLSGLSYSLTTDQSTYQVGQSIQITFTETNTSDQPVTVDVAPTDFTISQNGDSIWQSNPGNANQPPPSETLQPGQSLTQTAAWDGTTPDQEESGPSINSWGDFVVSNPNAPQDDTATFQITDPISTTLTTDQPVYQVGEPVELIATVTDTADQPITFFAGPDEAFSIDLDGTAVMRDSWEIGESYTPGTWQPGAGLSRGDSDSHYHARPQPRPDLTHFAFPLHGLHLGPDHSGDRHHAFHESSGLPAGAERADYAYDQSRQGGQSGHS